MKVLLLVLVVTFFGVGCSSVESLRPGEGGVTVVFHDTDYDRVWDAVVKTATRNLHVVESTKEAGVIRAEYGATAWSWGEVVGVFVNPTRNGAAEYVVEVQTLRRYKLQVTGPDLASEFISDLKAELGESQ
jgi:uncharacterized lipoprotein